VSKTHLLRESVRPDQALQPDTPDREDRNPELLRLLHRALWSDHSTENGRIFR